MAAPRHVANRPRTLQAMLHNPAASGLLLMAVAALALVVANSPLGPAYAATLRTYAGPLSIGHWINDGLMALFFLLVGLEIKREVLQGQLSTPAGRILPGIAAAGGMALPAAVFAALNWGDPATMRGWAIPAATDIAFALGVLALLGSRVPASLKVFLTALAIIGALAFADAPLLQDQVKVGILAGSLLAGLAGWAVLRFAPIRHRAVVVS